METLLEKDAELILQYVELAKKNNRVDCIYKTDKVSGPIYALLELLKKKLPNHKIWYMEPVNAWKPLEIVEMDGIHIEWIAK
jgi:hypothetical protein